MCHLQDLLQLAQEEDLFLAVGQRPEAQQRPQHRLAKFWVLLHELRRTLCSPAGLTQTSGQGLWTGLAASATALSAFKQPIGSLHG